ncbi:class I SAM-dependent methyltransferase [uncultured Deinococcus sp.]|uniref:class I SAM-dependent methyltransferase n=1 Tax=uncultured Deinococcus sp. TaxID=158789 RepID=UPI0025829558|nr:class I SAM-dependent methyltransferase [uncultured Deinococcus sp.]
MPHWADTFYDFQERHTGWYSAPVHASHHRRAEQLRATHGGTRLLELGSGGGQFAVAAALAGYEVTALDLRPGGAAHALTLAAQHGVALEAVTGDFYAFNPSGAFDLIVSWDGFGVGTDADQRRLLRRLPGWLAPGGRALIEVYMPLYWARHAGYTREWSTPTRLVQTYGFDAETSRLTDTYVAGDEPPQTQSLRYYAPADFRLLLEGTGLTLLDIRPGGAWNPVTEIWSPEVPVAECMQWVAVLAGTSP